MTMEMDREIPSK